MTYLQNFIKLVLAAFMALLLSVFAMAQSDDGDSKNDLRMLYTQAAKQQYTDEGLRLSTDLYDKAVRVGDPTLQCMTLNLQMNYYKSHSNKDKFNDTAERLKATAKKENVPMYYYFAYSAQVLGLANMGNIDEALSKAKQMSNEALSEKDGYGITGAYKAIADIYYGMGDFTNAKTYYKKGIDYAKANYQRADLTMYYAMLSIIGRKERNYAASLTYAEEGMKYTKSAQNIAALKVTKAFALYMLERFDEFKEILNEIGQNTEVLGTEQLDTYYELKVREGIINKDFDESLKWAEKNHNELNRVGLKVDIYEAKGDSATALRYYRDFTQLQNERQTQLHSKDLAEANARFENERLKAENLKLELVNTSGKLKMAQAIARQKETEAANAKLEIYNKELNLHNSDLRASKLKTENALKQTELDRQKAEMERNEANHRTQLSFLVGGIVALVIVVLSLIINRQNAKRFIKRLTEKNNELVVARDKAQQSDRMKTLFVKNISHEVRTPLNAIVGFTDLMLDPDMPPSQEEQTEYRGIIKQNIELLTGLVNDVIMLSEFQSGNVELNISQCHVNKLCRMAIDTVAQRKPDNVDLSFTTNVADDFTIMSDSRRIDQILINFLTNAEKYTTQGSITLDCSLNPTTSQVVFTVTDTGPGIPREKQAQVFEGFEKLESFHQGMGIGLKLCAFMANKLGADIGIDGNYTQGARFYLAVRA